MRIVFLILVVLALAGCDEEPPHPNQQAVDRAEKLTDQAIEKTENAERGLQHERRLRDLDKLTYEADVVDAQSELITWRGFLICLSIVLVIVIVWLAHEVRTRKTLSHVLRAQFCQDEEVKRE